MRKSSLPITQLRFFVILFVALTLFNAVAQSDSTLRPTSRNQPQAYLHDVWTTENGLPQNDVKLLQTHDGYLWLGTHGGLARFDGVKFTVFDTGNNPGLQSNRILCLAEDAKGDLWIGTQYGGITRYSSGVFTTFTTRDGLPDDSVFDVLSDRRGNLWISTPKGLACFSNGHFTIYNTKNGLPSDGSGFLREGKNSDLWFISGGRLLNLHNGVFTQYTSINGFPEDWGAGIFSMQLAPDGSLWLATAFGLVRFIDGNFTVLAKSSIPQNQKLPGRIVISIYLDRHGNVRLLMPDGLGHFADGEILLDTPMPELSQMNLRMWTVKTAFEDREGNLWIGTGGQGLHRFKPRQITAFGAAEGLLDESFNSITGDGGDGMWLGSANSAHSLFRFQSGRFTPWNINAVVRSLYQAKDGTLLIGTERDGIYQIQGDRIITDHPLNPALKGASINALYQDRNGRLWIGMGGDEGQQGGLYCTKDGVTIRYLSTDGLVSNDVRFITESRDGDIWIGTTGGLSRFRNDRFENFTTERGLSNNYVRDVYQDSDGTIWIGTYGGGLNRYRDGHIVQITTTSGLFDNVVSRILEDNSGNLWMSCNRGIYRASRRELNDFADGRLSSVECISYGVADGMKSNETNGGAEPAGWKAPDGSLWFPTVKGVVTIDPENLNTIAPPVVIEKVLVGKTSVDPRQTIRILPRQGDLEISYTGLSLVAPEKMRFKYKLNGYDSDWVDAGTRRVAYYTNISPGQYTFQVIASNNDGIWGTRDANIHLVVIPPFWRTWWFVILTSAVAVIAVFLMYRRRVGKIRRAHRAQEEFSRRLIESQESERKRIAGELHDSLGQNLLIIKNYALLGLSTLDEQSPITERLDGISNTASVVLDEVRAIAHNLRPYQLDRLGLTRALESIIKTTSNASTIELNATVDKVDGLLDKESEINLFRIVQEAVNNILKHSNAQHAHLVVTKIDDWVEVRIEDDGCGFNLESQTTGDASGLGFGLFGIHERARILGVRPIIRSTPGHGTTIQLRIPHRNPTVKEGALPGH